MMLTMGNYLDQWALYLQTKGHLQVIHIGSLTEVLSLYDDLWKDVIAFDGGLHLQ